MSLLPIYSEPKEDELLYSWLHRLARENGLSMFSFACGYLNVSPARNGILSYDPRREIVAFCNSIGKEKDLLRLYLSTSTFDFETQFQDGASQARYVNSIFQPQNGLNPPVNNLVNEIRICPDCLAEDEAEYGFGYLHKAHHYSGVCTCYKHGKSLMKYNGIKNHEIEYNLQDYQPIEKETDENYARYVKKIADLKYFAGLEHVQIMLGAKYKTTKDYIHELMIKYPDPENLPEDWRYNEPIIKEKKCRECGNIFYTTDYAQDDGWGCPECNKNLSDQEIFERIVSTKSKGEYSVAGDFAGMGTWIKLKHNKCGLVSKFRPRSFLFEGVRCECERIITVEEARRKVETNKGFKLIKFTRTENPVTIFHEECGRTFTCSYRKFVEFPGCRLCKPKYMTPELYKERVHKLVGDEYELITDYVDQKTKIKIKHNVCGTIREYQPNHFLEGQRCRVCAKMSQEWLNMYQLLCDYKAEYGHINIPKRETYKGKNLGLWCQHQRDDYKNKKSVLTKEKIQKMEEIGFNFAPLETEWERRYEQYKRYIKETGTAEIARRFIFENEKLGAWVDTQRKRFAEGKMSAERIAKLHELDPERF